jgi:hypothetical protein
VTSNTIVDPYSYAAIDHLHDNRYLQLSGGVVTGPILVDHAISLDQELVTKSYVDNRTSGLTFTAGNGLVMNVDTLNIVGSSGRIKVNEDNIDLYETTVAGSGTKFSVDKYGRITAYTNLSSE